MKPSDAQARERSFDRYLLVGCTLGLLIVILLLLSDFSLFRLTRPDRGAKTVARISEIKNKVRKRPSGLPVWSKARSGESVQNKDQVFTDEGSSTIIEFTDGSQVELGENTLVTVERQESKTQFNVVRGAFSAKSGGGEVDIEVNVGGMKTTVSRNTEINVKREKGGGTSIAVSGGKAQITSEGKTVELDSDQLSRFNAEGKLTEIRKIPFKLIAPKSGATVFFQKRPSFRGGKQRFSWKAVDGIKNYQLEVAKDSNFRKIVKVTKVAGSSIELNLPEGNYYWRIGAKDSKTGKFDRSLERSVRLVEDRAPRLWRPDLRGIVAYKQLLRSDERGRLLAEKEGTLDGAKVKFFWETMKGVPRYAVQIASDKNFEKILYKETSSSPFYVSKTLGEGEYFWRVRNVASNRPSSPWSLPRTFSVKQLRLPGKPRTISPEDDAEVSLQAKADRVLFKWQRDPMAHSYWLQVARDDDFEKLLLSKKVRGTQFRWSPKEVGDYYWRVRAWDVHGRRTPYSEGNELEVDVAPVKLLEPPEETTITLVEHKGELRFTWQVGALAKNYVFQLAKDKSFDEPLFEKELRGGGISWKKLALGKYYWRVLAYVPGKSKPTESQIRELEVVDIPLPEPPKLEPEIEIDIDAKFERGPPESLRSWLSIIRSAFAKGDPKKRRHARVRWKAVGKKFTYQVEIARDEEFRSLVVKKQVQRPYYDWYGVYPGKFYMRVATVDKYNRRGKFSNTSTLMIRPSPPKPFAPVGRIRIINPKRRIALRWKPVKDSVRYEFQISDERDFSDIEISESTWAPNARVKLTKSGAYYWRVKAIGPRGLETRYSKPLRFALSYAPRDPKPDDSVPVLLSWKKLRGAKSYRVQVAKGTRFRPLTVDEDSVINRKRVNLVPGTYYWRVAGINSKKKQGPWSRPKRIVVRAPPRVARGPTARGSPRRTTSGAGKSSSEQEPRGDPKLLILTGAYAPALNSYSQTSSDPTAFYSGLNPISYGGGLEFWWKPNSWGIGVLYARQSRTVFANGEISASQSPISLLRQKAWGGALIKIPSFLDPNLDLTLRLGYQYKNLVSFRIATSTTLFLVNSDVHSVRGGFGLDYHLTNRLLLNLDVWYGYPLSINNISVSGPLNLTAEISGTYYLSSAIFMELAYLFDLNRFSYIDDADTLAGSRVTGTITDNNHFVQLRFGANIEF